MFSIASAPAKQSVTETLCVLGGRLGSATLLEDRRAAILGLRSFAKQYPATVASVALKSFIDTLRKDGEDVDTVKSILETLLMLFRPNEDSPEASEEITLWLADEFAQRQENVTMLLDFLEITDFHCRLYTLQLLTAILSARTERMEECVFAAPLGISRLVGILDDGRDVVRNEAIGLLTYLTPTSAEIQKLVAFESAFERLLSIVKAEGSLGQGGQIVEDCFILLANLLRLNASNQSLFRETGYFAQMSQLLEVAYKVDKEDQELASWAQAQRLRNTWALLAIVRLFLVHGTVAVVSTQNALWHQQVFYHALQLAFNQTAEDSIRAEALVTCADAIRGNPTLQESFASLQVPAPRFAMADGNGGQSNGATEVYVVDALLDLALGLQPATPFEMRLAACDCVKAYCSGHDGIREHFLRRAIDGHKSGVVENANVLTVLLDDVSPSASGDPYRIWFAAVIMLHLVYDNHVAKDMLREVSEGDEASGEEVVTSVQIMTAHLLQNLSSGSDARIIVGYLMLLSCMLFEDLEGVNDFLAEGSSIQRIVQSMQKDSTARILEQGLCAALLGIVYEFSTKDSPIARATLQPLLITSLGRDRYIDKLTKLRSHPSLRDFEVLPRTIHLNPTQGLPDVYFDPTFVDFFKDNYSRLLRAIDREPGMEIPVISNGVQKGISRDMVDSLRAQVEEQKGTLQENQEAAATLERQLGQEQADHRRTRETTSMELSRIKGVNESLQRHHELEIRQTREVLAAKEADHQKQVKALDTSATIQMQQVKAQADKSLQVAELEHTRKAEEARKKIQAEADRFQRRAEAEMADLKATISRLEVDIVKANKNRTAEVQTVRDELSHVKQDSTDIQAKLQGTTSKLEEANSLAKQKQEEKDAVQGELDDLLMVFSDLEEKVNKYKDQLRSLNEPISDGEEDGVDDEDDGDEDEDEVVQ